MHVHFVHTQDDAHTCDWLRRAREVFGSPDEISGRLVPIHRKSM